MKVEGLNDSKYIGAAVYVTSIITTVLVVSLYTLYEYLDVFAIIFSTGLFSVATLILCLVFGPLVRFLSSDSPH